jgi:hypothetical protein
LLAPLKCLSNNEVRFYIVVLKICIIMILYNMFFKTLAMSEVLSADRAQHFPMFTNVLQIFGLCLIVHLSYVTIQLVLHRERLRTLWAFHPGIPLPRFDHFLRAIMGILIYILGTFFLLLLVRILR